jgi:hypothetical protein
VIKNLLVKMDLISKPPHGLPIPLRGGGGGGSASAYAKPLEGIPDPLRGYSNCPIGATPNVRKSLKKITY